MSLGDLIPAFRTNLSMILDEGKGKGMSKSRHSEAQMIGALQQQKVVVFLRELK